MKTFPALACHVLLSIIQHASAWVTQNVALPLTTEYTTVVNKSIQTSFHEMVEAIGFFEHVERKNSEEETLSCTVPLMGKAQISLEPNISDRSPSGNHISTSNVLEYTLRIGADNEEDLGFLCNKLLPVLKQENLSIHPLRVCIAEYMNSLPPDPGYVAHEGGNDKILSNMIGEKSLEELMNNGFVVLDSKMITAPVAAKNLSQLLVTKTGQGKSTRGDNVSFLTEKSAEDCGLIDQFRLLMSITSYLNDNLEFEESEFEPLFPGTNRMPLTNPLEIQAAEYKAGDFYTEHSDNSLVGVNRRSNYRCYTCILYLNDDWDCDRDGGALRIYPDSLNVLKPRDASVTCEYMDVNPENGQLLIFDSRLVHSVEEVTSTEKCRLALTLWTLRPENSGVNGEVYDAGSDI